MQTLNANQYSRSGDPVWYFLGEFPLSEFLSEHDRGNEITAGILSQAVLKLGMPAEWVENIEMTLVEFAKKALVHFKQGELELPGRIRVFCQKKIIDDVNSARAASRSYQQEQAVEQAQMVLDSGTKTNGGWGYFLIERGEGSSSSPSMVSRNSVDLYLYKEGG